MLISTVSTISTFRHHNLQTTFLIPFIFNELQASPVGHILAQRLPLPEEETVEVYYSEAISWREQETKGDLIMLKITIRHQAPEIIFIVEGKLVGLWVKELEKCWQSVLAVEPSRSMLVNLAGVTFIDSEGKALLTSMYQQGVKLLSAGILINAIVDEIKAKEWQETEECSHFKQD